LASLWHPDKNPTRKGLAVEAFRVIGEAYSVLADPNQRNIYDKQGKLGL
jgi:DnaJ-class molecular chaperone